MNKRIHPYKDLSERAFWKSAVASQHVSTLSGLFDGIDGLSEAKIATAGSCFAQHIGKALRRRRMRYLDLEPPPEFLSSSAADRLGYGVYSCRYGNIYTVRQLLQLFLEAHGKRTPGEYIWKAGDRYFDALRPGLQPEGFETEQEVIELRRAHLSAVRTMFSTLDIFVFTLGLTEAWEDRRDHTVYPTAPGVIAGSYDPKIYGFSNFRYPDVRSDMEEFYRLLREVRPEARLLLTVSPVPLAATASSDHVLVATTQSKATLRAVAGDLAAEYEGIYYFPSYEIITGQPTRHGFYAQDLRNVVQAGVDEVMRHFFVGAGGRKPDEGPAELTSPAGKTLATKRADDSDEGYEHCEEALLGRL